MLDLENSYLQAGVWGTYNQSFGPDQILDPGMVLCYAAKWAGESKVYFRSVTGDCDFLHCIWELLNEADAVVTYNGKRHDLPLLNREFIKAGMGPPSKYKHIDLYDTIKSQFKFPSNRLQHVLTELELPTKLEHEGFRLWRKWLDGDEKAHAKMRKYNIQDTKVTEKLYFKLRPWITNHPNYSLYKLDLACTKCGSDHIELRGYDRTKVNVMRRYHCLDCGGWSRSRYSDLDADTRKKILV